LVGENIISTIAAMVIPTTRREGPSAVPGMWPPRRSIVTTHTTRPSTIMNMPKRRVSHPSELTCSRY
jgi:hypothetical protein